MIVRKSLTAKNVMQFAGHHLGWLVVWMGLVTALYNYTRWEWMTIPWLPLSVIGTAVAFYVGFKNNQAYDRLWEGRKIWGGIVNSSRKLGSTVRAYIIGKNSSSEELHHVKRTIIYRHIAWLYTLREQLLVPTQWEHVSLNRHFGRMNRARRAKYGTGMFEEEVAQVNLKKYLPIHEHGLGANVANMATFLIDRQSQEFARLTKENLIEPLKQIELQRILDEFYEHQGKAERIKRFPLPRQYGSFSLIFVAMFIFLLPFGMVGEFSKMGESTTWLAVPFGVLIGWIYIVMELIGDYSENPFEGLINDVPMLSICRTIEIDLLQMLGETELPPPVQPKHSILM